MGCSRYRMSFLLTIALIGAGSAACNRDETQPTSSGGESSSEMAASQSAPAKPVAGPTSRESANDPSATTGTAAVAANAEPPKPQSVAVIDPAVPQAARAIATAWGNIQSMSQEVEIAFLKMKGDEKMMSKKGYGTVDYRLTDGKWFMRSKTMHEIRINVKDVPREDNADEILTYQRLLRIAQGPILYILSEGAERKYDASKQWTRPKDLQYLGGKPMVALLRRLRNVRLGPEQTLDGKDVVVFESESSNGNVTNRFFVEKATGLLLKAEGTNTKLETTFTYTVKSTKFDVTFPDDHFELTLPEGVEFRDLTQAQVKPEGPSPEPSQDGSEE